MAITGISSIDNKQIIAAGALSAISANQALVTSGGDSLQGLYDTVSTNSGSWTGGGGGSVTSPLGTISVDGSNIEATNSAVGTIVTPSASALLGDNARINGPWDSPSVFSFTLPTTGGTLYAIQNFWYSTNTFNFSGKDSNGNIITGSMTVPGQPGTTATADLNEIVSDISAQGTQSTVTIDQFYATSPSASNSGVYELAWKSDIPAGNIFTGYNTYTSGTTSYSAVVDTDYKLTAGNITYSLIGAYTNANNKFNKVTGSNTLFEYSGNYEMGNKAYSADLLGTTGVSHINVNPNNIYMEFNFGYQYTAVKADKVYLTFDATQSGTVNSSGWNFLSSNNNNYTFVRYCKPDDTHNGVLDANFSFDYNSWGAMSNITGSADIYSAFNLKELAFKDDLTGGSVPDEVMSAASAVSANSATWNETTDTLSANSAYWGGNALPISAGAGVKMELVDNTLVFSNDETLLYSTSAPADTINLSEASTGFEKLRLELSSYQSREIVNYTEVKPNASYLTYFANALIPAATYPLQIAGIQFTANNAKDYTMTTGVRMCYKVNATYGDQYTTIATTDIRDVGFITKIWGINRIAGV